MTKRNVSVFMLALLFSSSQLTAAVVRLFDSGLNIDASGQDHRPAWLNLPAGFTSGLDTSTGLGTLSATVTSPGTHNIILYLDLDIDSETNGSFNESGAAVGSKGSNQFWQIGDSQSFAAGNIFDQVFGTFSSGAGSLTNNNDLGGPCDPNTNACDVALALGYVFTLAPGDKANLTFTLSTTAPLSAFYLQQSDAASAASVFFSSSYDFTAGPVSGVPEPGTVTAGIAIAGLLLTAHRRRRT